jgi:hypothetical protein
MEYLKSKNGIVACFDRNELESLFKKSQILKGKAEMAKRGVDYIDLHNSKEKMIEVASAVANETVEDRDDHEIFSVLHMYLDFYPEGSQVCFELENSFSPKRDRMVSLDDLKRARKEKSLSDFIIRSSDGRRSFQLKRYRGIMKTVEIVKFIKEKLLHYCNDLGNDNLLLVLQSEDAGDKYINFKEINDEIKKINIKGSGEILISYNDKSRKYVMITVYPKVTISEIPIVLDPKYMI